MYITYFSLEAFRRFIAWEHTFTPGVHVFVAPNAQGKTTLLEAAAYLSTFSSYRTARYSELLNQTLLRSSAFLVARIRAGFVREDAPWEQEIEVRWVAQQSAEGERSIQREIWINGVRRRVQDALGAVYAVLFLPQMLEIVDGPPEVRRRFINMTLAPVVPGYVEALTGYTHALEQRNALLKQASERPLSPEELEIWDHKLAQYAVALIQARRRALEEWNALLVGLTLPGTVEEEVLRLVYLPELGLHPTQNEDEQLPLFPFLDVREVDRLEAQIPRNERELRALFLEQLRARRGVDLRRGHTTIGPHRDDFRFLLNGQDMTLFGSRGQVRNALLRLKAVEVRWYRQKTGVRPVLLLDEILAELDVQRRRQIVNVLLEQADDAEMTWTQVWMTSVEPVLFHNLKLPMHLWKVTDTGLTA